MDKLSQSEIRELNRIREAAQNLTNLGEKQTVIWGTLQSRISAVMFPEKLNPVTK